jgi:cation transport protein ChaC
MALTPELVARCWRRVPEADDPRNWWQLTAEEHAALAERLLAEAGGAVAIFAYGSPIWNAGFALRERRPGIAHG